MNLDQQIRRRLIADEEGRYPGSLTGKVFELTTAIRAVLHETARWREGSVHGTPAGLALQLEGLIAIQLGITEKQDETDTTAGESPCPTCQSLNVIGTKSYWTCTCDYGTTAQDPPGSDPNCPVHQQPAGLTINDPIELTPEQFNELRQAWLDRNPELPADAPPFARYARRIDRLTMQTGPVQPRTRVINRDEEASQ